MPCTETSAQPQWDGEMQEHPKGTVVLAGLRGAEKEHCLLFDGCEYFQPLCCKQGPPAPTQHKQLALLQHDVSTQQRLTSELALVPSITRAQSCKIS